MKDYNDIDTKKYEKNYDEASFWKKIKKSLKGAGIKVIYASLKLFFAAKDPNTPLSVKATIWGALGYFISPVDFIPDITPVAGFSDDLGVLASVLVAVSSYITPQVKDKAKVKLNEWFDSFSDDEIE